MKKIQITKDNIDIYLVAENDLVYPLKGEEMESIKINITTNNNMQLPLRKGDTVGSIDTYLNGKLINKDNLVSLNDVKEKSFIDKVFDYIKGRQQN